ncbi:hypothetical protein GDO86_010595 [Hymenochirus boettgeri]|uniref:Uncharacterized protein n=1 Tax=Hymenochirus boettgeri TaxID=247094 RepID=A0A8T2JQM7_9PIPI|nr:hypothetical protein GDO86_010595 [Hymenochirus boettgeri]
MSSLLSHITKLHISNCHISQCSMWTVVQHLSNLKCCLAPCGSIYVTTDHPVTFPAAWCILDKSHYSRLVTGLQTRISCY